LYLCRQRQDLCEGVNRVEIDLLRDGEHATLAPVQLFPRPHTEAPYHVCVCPIADDQSVTVYQLGLADRLPTISVPISGEYSDVPLNLANLFDECYRGAAYDRWARYDRPCDPPLTEEQQAWAEAILLQKGLLK
jgi:hypothetical protein